MTKIDLNYSDFIYPWEKESIIDRLNIIFKSKRKKKIIYIYGQADNSTFRYRVYNMCEALNKGKNFAATYFFVDEINKLIQHLNLIDYIVIARVGWSIELDNIISKAISHNIKVYFDVDDLVYDVTKIPMLMNALDVKMCELHYQHWFAYVSRFSLTASYCEACITTNKFLADKMKRFFKKPTHIVPNFINSRQMQVSDDIYRIKQKKECSIKKNTVLLGYFSGSPSHNNDFKLISDDLAELMQKNNKIKLRIVGYLDLPENLSIFVKHKRIEFLPMQNHLDLQVKIAECDVNLVPLIINEFTNCKSELKYFEAAIVGTPTITSPTFIYKKTIKNGKNGYIANTGEWGKIIEQLVLGNNNTIIDKARTHAKANYFGTDVLTKIESVFQQTKGEE